MIFLKICPLLFWVDYDLLSYDYSRGPTKDQRQMNSIAFALHKPCGTHVIFQDSNDRSVPIDRLSQKTLCLALLILTRPHFSGILHFDTTSPNCKQHSVRIMIRNASFLFVVVAFFTFSIILSKEYKGHRGLRAVNADDDAMVVDDTVLTRFEQPSQAEMAAAVAEFDSEQAEELEEDELSSEEDPQAILKEKEQEWARTEVESIQQHGVKVPLDVLSSISKSRRTEVLDKERRKLGLRH